MKVEIKTIPHSRQRYDTCGDWRFKKDGLVISISRLKNENYEFLIALHEFVEAYLCYTRNISEKDVTDFDKNFEKKRKKGNTDEPGDHPDAPYHNEHLFASYLEELMADEMGVEMGDYQRAINKL